MVAIENNAGISKKKKKIKPTSKLMVKGKIIPKNGKKARISIFISFSIVLKPLTDAITQQK